jgi:hypothetical protein
MSFSIVSLLVVTILSPLALDRFRVHQIERVGYGSSRN